MNGKLMACGLIVLAAGSVSAQISKQGSGYLFRMKFAKGSSVSYVMNMKGSAQGQAYTVKMPMTQKITDVSAKGVATVSVTLGTMAMTMNGKAMNRPMPGAGKPTTMQMDSQGHVVGGAAQQTSVALPDKPVAVGSTWKASTTVPGGMGNSMQVDAIYKFARIERLGSYNVARLTVTMKGTGQMAISGTGTLWLNMADGSMVKNVSDMTMTMGQMVMPMNMIITRK